MKNMAWSALAPIISFLALASLGMAQISSEQFVIDVSKPYAYLKFDHIGDRKPVNDWESSKGLWLRLVNNSSLPIKINVFGLGSNDPGVGVNFETVPAEGRIDPDIKLQKKPFGYALDIGTSVTIAPKGDLLFSVPAECVTKQWYIKVKFYFDLPGPKLGYHPYSVVDFRWYDIPSSTPQPQPTSILHEPGHVVAGWPPFCGWVFDYDPC